MVFIQTHTNRNRLLRKCSDREGYIEVRLGVAMTTTYLITQYGSLKPKLPATNKMSAPSTVT